MLGHPERGEKLIAEIEAARARLHAAPKPPFATALLVNRGGYTAGERSLAAALLAEAGLKPPAGAPPGYGGYVQLEKLLVLHPDVIVLNNQPRDAADQGSYNLTHPALNALYPPAAAHRAADALHALRRPGAGRGVRLSGRRCSRGSPSRRRCAPTDRARRSARPAPAAGSAPT